MPYNDDEFENVPDLRTALYHPDTTVLKQTVSVLRKSRDPNAVSILQRALNERDATVRRKAVWALGQLGFTRELPVLYNALNDPDALVRAGAALALGEIGHANAIPELQNVLSYDPDPVVREAAAKALGKIGQIGYAAIPDLSRVARNIREHASVRIAAIQALGEMKHESAAAALLQVLRDRNMRVFRASGLALAKIEEVQPVLIQLQGTTTIYHLQNVLSNPINDEDILRIAVWALGCTYDHTAIPSLVEALKYTSLLDDVLLALEKFGDATIRNLEALLNTFPDVPVRKAAVSALGQTRSDNALPALSNALNDPDWGVQGSAMRALKSIGSPAALALLDAQPFSKKIKRMFWG